MHAALAAFTIRDIFICNIRPNAYLVIDAQCACTGR